MKGKLFNSVERTMPTTNKNCSITFCFNECSIQIITILKCRIKPRTKVKTLVSTFTSSRIFFIFRLKETTEFLTKNLASPQSNYFQYLAQQTAQYFVEMQESTDHSAFSKTSQSTGWNKKQKKTNRITSTEVKKHKHHFLPSLT